MATASEEGTEKRPARGRYLAEYVCVTEDDPAVQPQQELDAKEGKEWHLVGVSGGLKEGRSSYFGTPLGQASAGALSSCPRRLHRKPYSWQPGKRQQENGRRPTSGDRFLCPVLPVMALVTDL